MTGPGKPRAGHRRGRPQAAGPLCAAVVCAVLFAALVVAVLLRRGGPLPGDLALHGWALRHRPPSARVVARWVTDSGTGVWPYLVAAGAGLLAGRGRGGRARAAAAALCVLLVGQGIRLAVMEAVARPRPPRADWAASATGYSIPSGHSTTSALAAGLLCWALFRRTSAVRARWLAGVALAWAVAVGLTRVYLGVHWPSDVLAGWLLATGCLSSAAALRTRLGGRLPGVPGHVPGRAHGGSAGDGRPLPPRRADRPPREHGHRRLTSVQALIRRRGVPRVSTSGSGKRSP